MQDTPSGSSAYQTVVNDLQSATNVAADSQLKSDLSVMTSDFTSGNSIEGDGGNVFDDCAGLGYSEPSGN
jgi:hypothetical protein